VAWTLAFLAWTAFVWIGRIRNALGDAALDAAGRTGPILLSVSFLALASLAAGLLVPLVRGRASDRVGRAFGTVLLVLAGWTTAVWVVRVADIALGGDHDVPFVVVHTVLGVVSVALGCAAVVSGRPERVRVSR
jgi:hypothetical protein